MVRLIDQLLVGAWAKMSNLGARVMHDAAIYAGMDFSTPYTVNRSMDEPGLIRSWLEKRSKGGESSHPLQDAAETAGKVAWCCCSPHRHIGGPRNFPPPLLPRNVPTPDGPCVPVVPDDLHSSLKKPPDLVGVAWAKQQFLSASVPLEEGSQILFAPAEDLCGIVGWRGTYHGDPCRACHI